MLKIVLVANTDWYLYNFRLSFAEFLRSQGLEVLFVCPSGRFIPEVQAKGFRWIQWEVGRKSLNPIQEAVSFFNLLEIYYKEKPDLVHHHTIKPVLYGSLAAKLIRVHGVINSITGSGYIFSSSDLKAQFIRPFVEIIYRWALRRPSIRVIFENKNNQQFFIDKKLITDKQSYLIPGVGVDTNKFSFIQEPAEPIVILLASRMLWDKGIGIFVEAIRVLQKRIKFRAVLAGEPDIGNPSSIDSKTLKNWDNENIIEWWGWQADMPSVYSQCHIVAFPTMYGEGIPTVLLEAIACGRPVVTTDVPGCRDVVTHGHNGLLVPVKNASALADALETLITNPQLRQKMGAAGREIAVNKFSLTKVNTETLAVYKKVLAS